MAEQEAADTAREAEVQLDELAEPLIVGVTVDRSICGGLQDRVRVTGDVDRAVIARWP